MIKVVRSARFTYRGPGQPVSTRGSVTASCLRSYAEGGRLEDLDARCEALADAIGVLAEAMLDAGLLNKRQLKELVCSDYEVVEDDT